MNSQTDEKIIIKVHNTENVSKNVLTSMLNSHKTKFKMFTTVDETFDEGDWKIEYNNYRIGIEFKFDDLLSSLNNNLLLDEIQRLSNANYTNRFLVIGGKYDSITLARVVGLMQHFDKVKIFIHESPEAAVIKGLYLAQFPGLKDKASVPSLVYARKNGVTLCEDIGDKKGKYYRVYGVNKKFYIGTNDKLAYALAREEAYKQSMARSISGIMNGITTKMAMFMLDYSIEIDVEGKLTTYRPFYSWDRIAKRSELDIEKIFYQYNLTNGTDRHEIKRAHAFYKRLHGML